MSDRRDEWSNNKMLTEAVDMTIWLAENMRVWIGCRRSEANGDEDSRNGMGM
jgi:exosome complex RNA-binding protein Rrp4